MRFYKMILFFCALFFLSGCCFAGNTLRNNGQPSVSPDVSDTADPVYTMSQPPENSHKPSSKDPLDIPRENYKAIGDKDFEKAYNMRSSEWKSENSYESYYENWKNNVAISLEEEEVIEKKDDSVKAKIRLYSEDQLPSSAKTEKVYYSGTVVLVKEDGQWKIDEVKVEKERDVKKDGGDSPVFVKEGWVYYMPSIGKEAVKIVDGISPSLSPDKKFLACSRTGLCVVEIDTKEIERIYESDDSISEVKWSPSGDLILFLHWDDVKGKSILSVINSDGTGEKELIASEENGVGYIFSPGWCEDGESVFFQDMHNFLEVDLSGNIIRKISLEDITGDKANVTSTDSFVPSPVNEKIMAFTMMVPGTEKFTEAFYGEPNTALFIYNFSTKTRERVTPADMLAFNPVWSDDGKYIFCCGSREKDYNDNYHFRIYRVSLDGEEITEIATGEEPDI